MRKKRESSGATPATTVSRKVVCVVSFHLRSNCLDLNGLIHHAAQPAVLNKNSKRQTTVTKRESPHNTWISDHEVGGAADERRLAVYKWPLSSRAPPNPVLPPRATPQPPRRAHPKQTSTMASLQILVCSCASWGPSDTTEKLESWCATKRIDNTHATQTRTNTHTPMASAILVG